MTKLQLCGQLRHPFLQQAWETVAVVHDRLLYGVPKQEVVSHCLNNPSFHGIPLRAFEIGEVSGFQYRNVKGGGF